MRSTRWRVLAAFAPLLLACTKRTNEELPARDADVSAVSAPSAASAASAAETATLDASSAIVATDAATKPVVFAETVGTYRWLVNKGTNMKFELPTNWTPAQAAQALVVKSGTPGVGVEFAPTSGTIAEKEDDAAMLVAINKTVQGAKMTGPVRGASQHGLDGFATNGTGVKDGLNVQWMMTALGDGKGHAMLTTAYWLPDLPKGLHDNFVRVLGSIAPAE